MMAGLPVYIASRFLQNYRKLKLSHLLFLQTLYQHLTLSTIQSSVCNHCEKKLCEMFKNCFRRGLIFVYLGT